MPIKNWTFFLVTSAGPFWHKEVCTRSSCCVQTTVWFGPAKILRLTISIMHTAVDSLNCVNSILWNPNLFLLINNVNVLAGVLDPFSITCQHKIFKRLIFCQERSDDHMNNILRFTAFIKVSFFCFYILSSLCKCAQMVLSGKWK